LPLVVNQAGWHGLLAAKFVIPSGAKDLKAAGSQHAWRVPASSRISFTPLKVTTKKQDSCGKLRIIKKGENRQIAAKLRFSPCK
jgi:hypothetical protein